MSCFACCVLRWLLLLLPRWSLRPPPQRPATDMRPLPAATSVTLASVAVQLCWLRAVLLDEVAVVVVVVVGLTERATPAKTALAEAPLLCQSRLTVRSCSCNCAT